MKVSTPKATIAIRGTGVAGDVQPTGTDTIVLLDGQIGVTSNTDSKTTQTIAQSGFGVTVNPNGLVSQPTLIPSTTLNTILNQIGPQSSSAGGTKEQQQIISALSADMLTGAGSVASKIGIENAVKLENAIVNAANTLAKSSNDTLLVSDLFKLINQNNDLKPIVDSISTANESYNNLDYVKVDVNLLPYFAMGPLNYMQYSNYISKTGSIQFDAVNVPMTTSNGFGSGSGNINTAQVVVNYDAHTFTTAYNLDYKLGLTSYNAVGSTVNVINNANQFNQNKLNNLPVVNTTNGASKINVGFSIFSMGPFVDKAGAINVMVYDGASCSQGNNCIKGISQTVGKPL
jgi:hypothetical protein